MSTNYPPPPPPSGGGDEQGQQPGADQGGFPPPPPLAPSPGYQQAPAPAYGQAPGYSQAPAAPVTRPPAMDNAVRLMQAGAVIAVIGLIISLLDRGAIRDAVEKSDSTLTSSQVDSAVAAATVFGIFFGLVGAGLWLWMAAANGKGKKWARIVATVFFALSALSTIYGFATPGAALTKVISIIQFLIGAGAVYFMYRKESSAFYEAGWAPRI